MMATLTRSLPLDPATWGLTLDSAGNWNLLTDANYSVAQDVACALRTFTGECWYDTTLGLLDFTTIFGHQPPLSYLTAKITAQALTMSNVEKVVVVALGLKDITQGATMQSVLTGSVLVWPLGSSTPIPVTF